MKATSTGGRKPLLPHSQLVIFSHSQNASHFLFCCFPPRPPPTHSSARDPSWNGQTQSENPPPSPCRRRKICWNTTALPPCFAGTIQFLADTSGLPAVFGGEPSACSAQLSVRRTLGPGAPSLRQTRSSQPNEADGGVNTPPRSCHRRASLPPSALMSAFTM